MGTETSLKTCGHPSKRMTSYGEVWLCSPCFRRLNPPPDHCEKCSMPKLRHGRTFRWKEGKYLCNVCRGRPS